MITEQPSLNIQAIATNNQEQSTTEMHEILDEADDEATNIFSQTTTINNDEADEDEYFEITDSPTQT